MFSYCTSQSKASTSPPKQQPVYKFHIHVHVGQFKVIKCPTLGKLESLCDLSLSTMKPQPFPLKSSNPPLSPYKLQDIHISCEIEAKVQMPQPFKHGYQISHPHEYYDNQISFTTERKSV